MLEFIRRLGKKVQGLWNKIFGKKDEKPQSWCIGADVKLGPGEIFLDGTSLGKVESITSISKDDISEESWESLKSIFGDGEMNCGWVEISSNTEMQKNFFNIPLTILPKRYWCKTLIITLVAQQPYDYQAVDMSQYEERGLAHYIVGSTLSPEQLEVGYEDLWDEDEDGPLWGENEDGCPMCSAILGESTLLYHEELGVWEIE